MSTTEAVPRRVVRPARHVSELRCPRAVAGLRLTRGGER
jgi:hypothetical protein